jgi:hypothetical protein
MPPSLRARPVRDPAAPNSAGNSDPSFFNLHVTPPCPPCLIRALTAHDVPAIERMLRALARLDIVLDEIRATIHVPHGASHDPRALSRSATVEERRLARRWMCWNAAIYGGASLIVVAMAALTRQPEQTALSLIDTHPSSIAAGPGLRR